MAVVREEHSYFAGPLPPPELLAAYKEAFEDCPQIIVKMADRQASERQARDKQALDADVNAEARGQWFGFVIAMTILAIGGLLAWDGRELAGFGLIAADVLGFAVLYLGNKYLEQKALERALRQEESED